MKNNMLPTINIVIGSFLTLYTLYINIFVYPTLLDMYSTFEIELPWFTNNFQLVSFLFLFLPISMVVVGFLGLKKIGDSAKSYKYRELNALYLKITIVVFLALLVLGLISSYLHLLRLKSHY